ncbi:TRAP transporter small permease [Bacillus sp. B15-48]|uniref:TRAP transporter small permease n=1 Tax=Bacillus sp. B15-48 TaxID=1548601 RepID=UPI00193F2DA1|nr:TRAP transporter small permease [Bacillus sp. B15-48]MBM4763633.1 TRAP transporter small permease subunit [Bacillus sp. B15-48]
MKIINKIEEAFISFSILFATLLVLVNVTLRMFGKGITWSEELIRFMLIWVTFIGISVCARNDEHFSIEFIPQLVRGKVKKGLMFVIYVLSLIFSVIFTWYSFKLLQFTFGNGQLTPGLGVPFALIYGIIPLSGFLLIIRYVQQLIKCFSTNFDHNEKNDIPVLKDVDFR